MKKMKWPIILLLFLTPALVLGQISPQANDSEEFTEEDNVTMFAHFFVGENGKNWVLFTFEDEDPAQEGVDNLRLAHQQTLEEIEAMEWEDFENTFAPFGVVENAFYIGTLIVPGDILENEESMESFGNLYLEHIDRYFESDITITYNNNLLTSLSSPLVGCSLSPTFAFDGGYGAPSLSPSGSGYGSSSPRFNPRNIPGGPMPADATPEQREIERNKRHKRMKKGAESRKRLRKQMNGTRIFRRNPRIYENPLYRIFI